MAEILSPKVPLQATANQAACVCACIYIYIYLYIYIYTHTHTYIDIDVDVDIDIDIDAPPIFPTHPASIMGTLTPHRRAAW